MIYNNCDIKDNAISRLAMLALALFPILNYYQGPVLSYGYWAFFVVIAGAIIEKGKNLFIYPRFYFLFWGYCAIDIFIAACDVKLTYFMPGGISLFTWSILLGFIVRFFDEKYFIRYTSILFAFSAVVLVLQEVFFWSTGSRFAAFLPLGNNLTYGISRSELLAVQTYSSRSCSIFAEPSHFAQFVLPLLAYDLFNKKNKKKLMPILSLIIVSVLLLLRSGNGLIGAMLLLLGKVFLYIRTHKFHSIIVALLLIPIAFYTIKRYADTEYGESVIERTSEMENDESAGSYIRLFRGYVVYSDLPTFNKIFGISLDRLLQMKLPSILFTGDKMYDSYFNGVQTVLIHLGIIGFSLLLFFYYNLARDGNSVSIAVVLTLLVLALMGQMYLSPTMLVCTGLAYSQKTRDVK